MVVEADKVQLIDASKTGTATTVGRDQIEKIPTISRSAEDITKLTPKVLVIALVAEAIYIIMFLMMARYLANHLG